jgi:hypothetical protein
MEIWVQFVAHYPVDNEVSQQVEHHWTFHALTADLLLAQDLDLHMIGHHQGTEGRLWQMEAQHYGGIVDHLIAWPRLELAGWLHLRDSLHMMIVLCVTALHLEIKITPFLQHGLMEGIAQRSIFLIIKDIQEALWELPHGMTDLM